MPLIYQKGLLLLSSIAIVLNGFSQPSTVRYDCQPGDGTCKYVFKIVVTKANRRDKEKVPSWSLTGFKIQGVPYLVTALHGIAKGWVRYGKDNIAIYAQNDSDGLGKYNIRYLMKPVFIDRKRDLIYLDFQSCETPRGMPFNPTSDDYKKEGISLGRKPLTNEELTIYGFPTNGILINRATQAINPYKELGGLLAEEQQIWFESVTSPSVKGVVIVLNPNDIQPGNSGSPIIRWDAKKATLVGVGDGAKLTKNGGQVITWAIPFDTKTMNFPETPKKQLDTYIAEQRELIAGYQKAANIDQPDMDYGLRASEESVLGTGSDVSRIDYARADPQFTIGGSLSYLYSVSAQGLNLEKRAGDRNTFLDVYAEYRLLPWLRAGVYGTSPYLQYGLIRSFERLNLDLFAEPVRSSENGWFKQVGGQISVAWRGVLWEGYAGAGWLPFRISDFQPNYRIFLGARHYLVPRRWLAAEVRAVWMSPDEIPQLSQPRLGNALITTQTTRLNTFYLCFGISLSRPHRFRP
jgi:hypothetical protein